MNWKRFLINLGGFAAAGIGAVITQHAANAPITGHEVAAGALLPLVTGLVGLFQTAPHQE